jgi:hypothetical protein
MLTQESKGQPYNKSEHNEHLRGKLSARSKSSIELKHQNISAVLDQVGLPYVRGYKPRFNYQELLRETVLRYVERYRQDLAVVVDNFEAQTAPGDLKYRGVLIDPPNGEPSPAKRSKARLPRKLDYAARDEHNRKLGSSGESWTVGYEQARLHDEGRPDLESTWRWNGL